MVSTGVAIILVALIFVGGGIFYAAATGMFTGGQPNQFNVGSELPRGKFEDPTKAPTNLSTGEIVNIDLIHFDSLTNDAKVEGTDVETSILGATGPGAYSLRFTGSDKDYQLQAADGGLITIAVEPKSTKQFILDRDEVRNRNPGRVEDMSYYDWDNDGDRQWVLRFNTKYLKSIEQTTQNPNLQIFLPWHNENTISLNSPADQTGIAVAAGTTVNIYWEGTGTSGDATYFNYITFTWNNTVADKLDPGNSYIQITSDTLSKRLVFSDAAESKTGTTTEWKWTLHTNRIGDADYVEFKPNTSTKVYFSTKLSVDLETDDNFNATLGVSTWDAGGSSNTLVSDTVNLKAVTS